LRDRLPSAGDETFDRSTDRGAGRAPGASA
jgi:hypothetical protein